LLCCVVAVCVGTNFELRPTAHAGSWSIERYIRMYQNCVYVDGNLEITYLEDRSYDLSFLSDIREVKYVYDKYVYDLYSVTLSSLLLCLNLSYH